MKVLFLVAFGVGGATAFGSLIGFFLKKIPHKFNDLILSFAAGVMLAAAVFGLIHPAVEQAGTGKLYIIILGILAGAVFLSLIDRCVPHLHSLAGKVEGGSAEHNRQLSRILLFVLAIAIHNFPEGLAAGVSFGTGDTGNAVSVALGIALQNIPEGMVIISPMLAAGVSARRTLGIALLTGVVEVVGTFLGYLLASISVQVLPFALAFAGGTMLYVISDEMIPETHAHGFEKSATFTLLIGFCFMLLIHVLLG